MLRKPMNAVMNLVIDNYALLDEKLDLIGEMLISKTDEVMKHAEEKLNEIVPTEEELGNIVDEMADQLYEKSMDLPYQKKTKAQVQPKTTTIYRMMNCLRRPGRRTQRLRA